MGGGAAEGLWRHQQWLPSCILPRIRNEVKIARNSSFCPLHKNNPKISTLHEFSHKIYFYFRKKLRKHGVSPKLAWPPATYDVMSRNRDSNWPSLNLSQNLRERWTNSCWKRQVLMFYPLGKNSEKTLGGGGWMPPPCLVRPRVNYLPYLKHSVVGCPSPYTLRYTCTVLLVFSVTPFKIDQNKNQNRWIDKVQNLGTERS